MTSDRVVRARIDGQVKEKAAKVLAGIGLSVSDAIRLLMVRIAAEKRLPFEVEVPNAETRAAIAGLEKEQASRSTASPIWWPISTWRIKRSTASRFVRDGGYRGKQHL